MVNQESSFFPKGSHLATQAEQKNNMKKNIGCNVTEILTPKLGNREPQQNYRLGTVSNKLLGV